MIRRISHVGFAVKNIEQTLSLYRDRFGLQPSGILEAPELKLKSAMLPIGGNFIELLEVTDSESEISRFVEKYGEGLYHICVVADDVDEEIESLKQKGVEVMELPPTPNFPFKRAMMARKMTKGLRIEIVTEEAMGDLLHRMFEKRGKQG